MHALASRPATVAPWWSDRAALARFVADLVAAELAALRHDPLIVPDGWTDALSLEHDLGLDSLEFLHVAGRLSGALQMHRSGVEDYLLARRTLGEWVDIATVALQHHDAELTFGSSGSTGQPKRCTHLLARLTQEADALAALFPGRRRVLCAVPGHHIYGFLFTQLLPQRLGLDGARIVDVRSHVPAALPRHAAPGDLVIGHPAFWQAALADGLAFPDDVVGVSSTAPCPDEVAAQAERCGLRALVQVYGSSETAGIGWRISHCEDYCLFPYLARTGAGERDLARTLPDGGTAPVEAPDVLAWSGQRTFAVCARRDGAVQVGGINVYPERVRAALLAHPGVADCAVRLMHPDEGTRLKAFIVRRPHDATADRDFLRDLRAWIDARLPAPERPKAFTLGPRLPVTAMGKPADWAIG
jgi:4-coumarate--CoA ligase (photoactive yellow protein activation family)